MSTRAAGWLFWSLVVLQVLLVTLGLVFGALVLPTYSGPQVFGFGVEVLNAVSVVAFPAVGALILSRYPKHRIGWIFCTSNLGWAVNNFAGTYARYALIVNPGVLPAAKLMVWLYAWPGFISGGLYILLGLLFPDGRLLSRRWRPVAWLVVGWAVMAAVASAFEPGAIDETIGFEISNPLGIQGPIGRVLATLSNIAFLLLAPLFGAAAVSTILRLRRAQGQERQQLKWLVTAVALVTVFAAGQTGLSIRYESQAAMPGWAQLWWVMGILSGGAIPLAAGIAILRYRLYDIDLIIRRTLIYSALTGTLALVYFGSVVLLQGFFRAVTGQGQNQLVTVLSTLAIAALFVPLRRRVQEGIDRRFYRKKYDAAKVLAEFSATVRDETDLDKLTARLVAVVQETMQPAHVSLWLKKTEPLKHREH